MADVPNRLDAALADRYRIERELGSGGMATVYLAEDLKHRRQVAIKVRGSTMERPDEARAQIDRALTLNVYSPWVRSSNALILCDDGRYAECIEEYKAALRIDPDYPMAQMNLAEAYYRNGNYDEAPAQVRRWWFPGDQGLEEALDRGYAEGGFRAAMLRYAETLAAGPELAERLCIAIAISFAWAGDRERTLDWLEIAYLVHDPNLPGALMLTARPELHDDPRFHDLRRRVGLPQQGGTAVGISNVERPAIVGRRTI